MSNIFLVDTSAWIFALRKNYAPAIKDRIGHLLRHSVILTLGMIKLELLTGAKTQEEFKRLKSRLDALEEVPSDRSLWESACQLGFTLKRKGVTVPPTDIFIASAAMAYGATLVHADRHFDMICKNTNLKVESLISKIRGSSPSLGT